MTLTPPPSPPPVTLPPASFWPAVRIRCAPGTTAAASTDARFGCGSLKQGSCLPDEAAQRQTFRPDLVCRVGAQATISVPSLEKAALAKSAPPLNFTSGSPVLTLQVRALPPTPR